MEINHKRLLETLGTLGTLGINETGRSRLAASDEDKAGRDYVVELMKDAGLEVVVDQIGNIFGIWQDENNRGKKCVMTGSHIDSVINAGQYDGCLGVLSAIEVVRTLKENGYQPNRPIAIGAFTNEEGVRYQPDMMGSLVYVGGMALADAIGAVGTDGTRLGDELARIGYAGTVAPGFLQPEYFIELHIEQGPILDIEGVSVGAVENLQGISWQRVTITGEQNHAGTTPTHLRRDAGVAAAKVNLYLRERTVITGKTLATVGTIAFEPNAVNVIPSKATFTVDLRNPDCAALKDEEARLQDFFRALEKSDGVKVSSEQLSRFDPVLFDEDIVRLVEQSALERGLSCKRITSGAGQDAQMLARICKTAMIFIPSIRGISHNPAEYSTDADVASGANILLDVVKQLSAQ